MDIILLVVGYIAWVSVISKAFKKKLASQIQQWNELFVLAEKGKEVE